MRKKILKYRELLAKGEEKLQEAGIFEAKNDAWVLFSEAFKMSRTQYFMKMNEEVEVSAVQYEDWLDKRVKREPLQYILQSAPFMGYDFFVNPNVLIPRYDTEVLVECVLQEIKALDNPKILDMCTGSGCIAISLALLKEAAKVMAVDISEDALAVSKINCERLNCTNVTLIQSDLFDRIEDVFDVIVSNPPYIPTDVIEGLSPEVKEFEPMLALDGMKDGLEFYRRLAIESKKYLKKGGYLFMEIGCEQAESVMHLLEVNGYTQLCVIKDLANLDRVVKARWR